MYVASLASFAEKYEIFNYLPLLDVAINYLPLNPYAINTCGRDDKQLNAKSKSDN